MKIQDGPAAAPAPRPMPLFSREPPTHFPPVEGVRLDGTPVALPADLPADATVLVVSFRDDLDAVSDQWARLVERMAEAHDGRVAVLELPVMGKALRHLGDVATMSVRGRVDDPAEAARTVPVYVKKKKFRKGLGLRGSDEVTAFLVGRDGAIAWTGDGHIDLAEIAALEAAITRVLARADGAGDVPAGAPADGAAREPGA